METAELDGVTKYAFGGINIYEIPVEGFLGHFTNVYLVLDREASLIDVGVDREKARADLERGFETIRRNFKESVALEDVSNIIITHGHLDHFGMLGYEKLKGKRLYIHESDSKSIKDFGEASRKTREQIERLIKAAGCGIKWENLSFVAQLPIAPSDYNLIEVRDGDRIVNGYTVYHTPGHSLGEICLKVGEVLFLGDHILSFTTPHQSPKSNGGAGLEVYLRSLRKVAELGIELGLPAHEDTIYSVKTRAEEIERFHHQRLEELIELCRKEKNLSQLTKEYYERHPDLIEPSYIGEFNQEVIRVLALDEIKAHVEYLLENNGMAISKIENGVIKYRSKA